ncbi:TolC family protein [Desulforamulus ruminis]|nr:TolC family protein [Desulforamulus ruminis]
MAIDRAMQQDISLRNAEYDVERGQEVRDYVADKLEYIPSGPVASSDVENLMLNQTQTEINYNMSRKNYEAKKDSVEMSVIEAYNEVIQAQEKAKVAEVKLNNADWQRRVALTSKVVGTLDNLNYKQAEANYIAAKTTLESSVKALEDAYQKFNQLMGFSPDARPVLLDMPELKPVEVASLDSEVSRILDSSPSVWLAEQNVYLAKLTKRLYDFTDSHRTEPYEAKEIDLKKAELSTADIKDMTGKTVRTFYYSLKQLEEQYAGAKESVTVAEEALKVAKVKYEIGMLTKSDLLKAETDLLEAQQNVLAISGQHQILAYAFKKPWAYGVGQS